MSDSSQTAKEVSCLTVNDLLQFPVWEYAEVSSEDIYVQPVRQLPLQSAAGKLLGTQVVLACGERVWCILTNFDLDDEFSNEHFLSMAFLRNGETFHLARYHDADVAIRGVQQLAVFLGVKIEDVFPISYDVSALVNGVKACAKGVIRSAPEVKLSRAELIMRAAQT